MLLMMLHISPCYDQRKKRINWLDLKNEKEDALTETPSESIGLITLYYFTTLMPGYPGVNF
jgi:hypothetical protein